MTPDALRLAQAIANLIWQKYDDEFGYRTEKMERNLAVSTDDPDNINFFVGQFDWKNQCEFGRIVEALTPTEAQAELQVWCIEHDFEEQARLAKSMGL